MVHSKETPTSNPPSGDSQQRQSRFQGHWDATATTSHADTTTSLSSSVVSAAAAAAVYSPTTSGGQQTHNKIQDDDEWDALISSTRPRPVAANPVGSTSQGTENGLAHLKSLAKSDDDIEWSDLLNQAGSPLSSHSISGGGFSTSYQNMPALGRLSIGGNSDNNRDASTSVFPPKPRRQLVDIIQNDFPRTPSPAVESAAHHTGSGSGGNNTGLRSGRVPSLLMQRQVSADSNLVSSDPYSFERSGSGYDITQKQPPPGMSAFSSMPGGATSTSLLNEANILGISGRRPSAAATPVNRSHSTAIGSCSSPAAIASSAAPNVGHMVNSLLDQEERLERRPSQADVLGLPFGSPPGSTHLPVGGGSSVWAAHRASRLDNNSAYRAASTPPRNIITGGGGYVGQQLPSGNLLANQHPLALSAETRNMRGLHSPFHGFDSPSSSIRTASAVVPPPDLASATSSGTGASASAATGNSSLRLSGNTNTANGGVGTPFLETIVTDRNTLASINEGPHTAMTPHTFSRAQSFNDAAIYMRNGGGGPASAYPLPQQPVAQRPGSNIGVGGGLQSAGAIGNNPPVPPLFGSASSASASASHHIHSQPHTPLSSHHQKQRLLQQGIVYGTPSAPPPQPLLSATGTPVMYRGGNGGPKSATIMESPNGVHTPIVRSALLEEFRANKTRKYELKDIVGYMIEFSCDQHGSRFIQQKLETASLEEKETVFQEVQPSFLQLMTDVFGNYVIQKFFEHGSQVQKHMLAKQMEGQVLSLSLQMYGCRVVQKALEHILTEQQASMMRELEGHVLQCVKDQNGNHVIQKAIERVPAEHIKFIIDSFHGQVYTLATHPYGCRVIQRMFEHCNEEQTRPLLDELHRYTNSLVQDQYGNYVIQHIMERGRAADRSMVCGRVQGHVLQLSKHKFASNVVEKCIAYGEPKDRKALIEEITMVRRDGTCNLVAMMKDQYANYVVQKMLDVVDERQRDSILVKIQPHMAALRKFTYGKHLITKVEKYMGGGGGSSAAYSAMSPTTGPSTPVSSGRY